MPIVLRQDVQLARLISRIEHGAIRVRQMVRGLSSGDLLWCPPEGGWGINHYLEHAIAVGDPYLQHLPAIIQKNVARKRFAKNGRWKVSVPAGIMRWTIGSTTKFKPMGRMPVPTGDVVDRFLAQQKKIAEMLRSADGLRLDRIHTRVGGLTWWRLADCFTLLVSRTERDLMGARRVREHENFPAGAMKRSSPNR